MHKPAWSPRSLSRKSNDPLVSINYSSPSGPEPDTQHGGSWSQDRTHPTSFPLTAASCLPHPLPTRGPTDAHLCKVTQRPDGRHPAEQMASQAPATLRLTLGSLPTRISKNRGAHRPALSQGRQACLVADVSGQKVPSSASPERGPCQCSPGLFLKAPSPRRGHRALDSRRQRTGL